jgi:hypothetical protein
VWDHGCCTSDNEDLDQRWNMLVYKQNEVWD